MKKQLTAGEYVKKRWEVMGVKSSFWASKCRINRNRLESWLNNGNGRKPDLKEITNLANEMLKAEMVDYEFAEIMIAEAKAYTKKVK